MDEHREHSASGNRSRPAGKSMRGRQLSESELDGLRGEHSLIYSYLSYIMSNIQGVLSPTVAAALYTPEGYLLRLYGAQDIKEDLSRHGLGVGALWSAEDRGGNAVASRIRSRRLEVSAGEENGSPALKKYVLIYSNIAHRTAAPPFGVLPSCGLAWIVPVKEYSPAHLTTVVAVAQHLATHLHMCESYYALCEHGGQTLLVLNENPRTKDVYILYHSANAWDTLQLPKTAPLSFQPLEKVIPFTEENQEFWASIKGLRKVQDYPLSLSLHGERNPYVITTYPYFQEDLRLRGVHCLITTPQKISAEISAKMGHSAIRTFDQIVGRSPRLQSVITKAKMFSSSQSNIMLLGESGTGKDVFAQAIHNTGNRGNRPYIAVNCGALPRDLIASELFGYESGAFTGAKRQGNIGKFELANGGTIFLDEIGELPLELQSVLLRVVEQKKLTRVGGTQEVRIDVRIISATNVDIPAMIAQKRFRGDLYYRLSTISLEIPALRERGGDVVLLAEHFARRMSAQSAGEIFSPEAKDLLCRLPWPGNVRELQNLVERVTQLYPEQLILPEHILQNADAMNLAGLGAASPGPVPSPAGPREAARKEPPPREKTRRRRRVLTEEDLRDALEKTGGNLSQAAKNLGISRKTFYLNMDRLGLW